MRENVRTSGPGLHPKRTEVIEGNHLRSFRYRVTDEPTGFVWGIVKTGFELDKLLSQVMDSKKQIQAEEIKVEVLRMSDG